MVTPKEIDFVVNDGDKKFYIQSAFQMDTTVKEDSELTLEKLFEARGCKLAELYKYALGVSKEDV